jgi:hypothetical protein
MFMVADSEEATYDELSQDQKAVIHAFAADLSQVVSTYGISPLSVDEDDLDEDDIQNNRVWSVVEYFAVGNTNLEGVEDDAYKTDAMLAPGVEECALTYHVAKNAYSGEPPLESNPYTSLFFVCTACDGVGCEACYEQGELIFSAVWEDKNAEFWRE